MTNDYTTPEFEEPKDEDYNPESKSEYNLSKTEFLSNSKPPIPSKMTNELTALAKVIGLIQDMKRANKDDNSYYYVGKWAGLDEAERIAKMMLYAEREQIIESRLSVIKENTLWDALTEESRNDYIKQASDYFNQNYTQDGK